jgi:hypothetical protein
LRRSLKQDIKYYRDTHGDVAIMSDNEQDEALVTSSPVAPSQKGPLPKPPTEGGLDLLATKTANNPYAATNAIVICSKTNAAS